MDAQSIFDKTWRHLVKQGHPAVLPNGETCAYRAPNGDMCAFGVHIPDDRYIPDMEDVAAREVIEDFLPEFGQHVDLIEQLQMTHDRQEKFSDFDMEQLKNEFEQIGNLFKLSTAVLNEEIVR